MEKQDVFRDIAERTGGDIYLGVVGGVRTGKSTFIKKFMELLVVPNIENVYDQERAIDELPQSGAGRTVMTTEPKFIPNEAVEVEINEQLQVKIRLVDCVGYRVEGALGYDEDEGPRMVSTPWYDEPIPFEEAAEIGTRKVISEHATMGIMMTTDGSITDIPRENYIEAEERVVDELKTIERPFLIVLNSTFPYAESTLTLADELTEKYDVPVLPLNVEELSEQDLFMVLEKVLYEFPVNEVNIALPPWVEELDMKHWLRQHFEEAVNENIEKVQRIRDVDYAVEELGVYDYVESVQLENLDMGTGIVSITLTAQPDLFYKILEEETGFTLEGERDLFSLVKELTMAKREYDKIAPALQEVEEHGYGVVTPNVEEMSLDEPELIRQGNRFGVKLKASAPSMHIIRADITTEITPIIGTEKQGQELVNYMINQFDENPTKFWNSEIFGKSVNDLVREGIQNKLYNMPDNAQHKLQETLQKIVNEGSGGLICIII